MYNIKLSYWGIVLGFFLFSAINAQSKLVNVEPVTSYGEYNNPIWSPDGEKLLITNQNNDNLYVLYLGGNKKIEEIRKGHGIGYQAHWGLDSKSIVFREKPSGGTFAEAQTKSVNISTRKVSDLPLDYLYSSKADINSKSSSTELFVYINLETLKLEAKKGVSGKPWVITKEEGQFYAPLVSPDQTKVIVHEGAHMYEYDIYGDKERKDLGVGLASDWLPDSSGIITFEDKSNDGHHISSSEIYMISEKTLQKTQLTNSSDKIETWSKISPDGKKLAFTDEESGKIFIGDLQLKK